MRACKWSRRCAHRLILQLDTVYVPIRILCQRRESDRYPNSMIGRAVFAVFNKLHTPVMLLNKKHIMFVFKFNTAYKHVFVFDA